MWYRRDFWKSSTRIGSGGRAAPTLLSVRMIAILIPWVCQTCGTILPISIIVVYWGSTLGDSWTIVFYFCLCPIVSFSSPGSYLSFSPCLIPFEILTVTHRPWNMEKTHCGTLLHWSCHTPLKWKASGKREKLNRKKKKKDKEVKMFKWEKWRGSGVYHHPLDTQEVTSAGDKTDMESDKCGWGVNFNGPNLGGEQIANI